MEIEKEPELPFEAKELRTKSTHAGVPKIAKIISTTVREIENGFHVANEGSLLLMRHPYEGDEEVWSWL